MYTTLLTNEEMLPAEGFDQALEVLTGTPWDGRNTKLIKSERNKLYDLLQVPEMEQAKPAAAPGDQTRAGASSSAPKSFGYEDLVREAAD